MRTHGTAESEDDVRLRRRRPAKATDDGPGVTTIDAYDRDGCYDPYDEEPAPPSRKPSLGSRVTAGIGELLITCGVLVALFLVYELWWTDITAHRVAQQNIRVLEREWQQSPALVPSTGPSTAFKPGQGFALLYIPKFGQGWRVEIMQGVSEQQVLDKGAAGHYPNSAMPWTKDGNFAIAGHRDTYGSVFHDLNQLAPGDLVYVQTATEWYTYRIDKGVPSTSKYNVSVVNPIPANNGVPVYSGAGRYITLTTCTPVYTSDYRLIWWGHMVSSQSAKSGVPASLAKTLPQGG